MELQALPSRIGQVRRIVSAQLRYWHLDPLIDPAALGVTELLTNVHRHAEPDKQCTVEIELLLDRLTVSVRDHDPRLPQVGDVDPVSHPRPGARPGRCGQPELGNAGREDGSGKVVWFTLPLPLPAVTLSSPLLGHGAGRIDPSDQRMGRAVPAAGVREHLPVVQPTAAR